MKINFCFLLIVFTQLIAFSNKAQSNMNSDLLGERQGFRNIKLGASLNNYPNIKKIDKDNVEDLYEYLSDYKYILQPNENNKLVNAKIKRILLKMFDGEIMEIDVFVEKKLSISMLIDAYGEPVYYSNETDLLSWEYVEPKENLRLMLIVNGRGKSGLDFYVLQYTDLELSARKDEKDQQEEEKKKQKIKNQF